MQCLTSIQPMNDGNFLYVFAEDVSKIPQWVSVPYSLQAADMPELINVADIVVDVDANGFTYGIIVPAGPTDDRLKFTYLRQMAVHG